MIVIDPTIKPPFGWPLDRDNLRSRSLVIEFPFNEGTGNIVNGHSGNVGHPSFNGNVTWGAGQDGPCLTFGGTDSDYLDFGASSTIADLPLRSMSGWIRPTALPAGGVAILSKFSGGRSPGWYIGIAGSDSVWNGSWIFTDGSNLVASSSKVTLGQWFHFQASQGATNVRLYSNGLLDNIGGINPASDAGTNMILGTIGQGSIGAVPAFAGQVGNLRMRNVMVPTWLAFEDYAATWGGYLAPKRWASSNPGTGPSYFSVSVSTAGGDFSDVQWLDP